MNAKLLISTNATRKQNAPTPLAGIIVPVLMDMLVMVNSVKVCFGITESVFITVLLYSRVNVVEKFSSL